MTGNQRDQFRERGFVVLRSVYSQAVVAQLRTTIRRLIDLAWKDDVAGAQVQWIDHQQKLPAFIPDLLAAKYDPAFGAWLDDTVIPAAESLLDAPVRCSWLTLYACGGGHPYSTNWHRDSCQFDCEAELPVLQRDLLRQCQVHAPLFDDDFLQVISGSHARAATPEEVAAMRVQDGTSMDLPGQRAVRLEPGDIAFRHGNIVHRGTNPQGLKRWTLLSNFWQADVPVWSNEALDRDAMLAPGHLQRMTPRTRECVQRYLDAFPSGTPRHVWEP